MERIRVLSMATGATFLIMLCYQSIKEWFFAGTLTPWQSHWITILFTTFLSGLVTAVVMKRLQSFRQRQQELRLREEKLATIAQVMRLVDHHVNNLGNTLQLIDLELRHEGGLKQETVDTLLAAVERTSAEMRRLRAIEDPFDREHFEITFP